MTTHSKHLISKTRNILGNLGVRFPQNKNIKIKSRRLIPKKNTTKTIRTHCVYLVHDKYNTFIRQLHFHLGKEIDLIIDSIPSIQ